MSRLLTFVKDYDARGGPANKKMGYDGYEKTPTTTGRFVIGAIEKHISKDKYAFWSSIPWGSGLKYINNVVYVNTYNRGHWTKLSTYQPRWLKAHKTELGIIAAIKQEWDKIRTGKFNGSEILYYKAALPDTWMFNEFGHISVKYFKDVNHDGVQNVRDKRENLLGDFIHTTPGNEALAYYNSRVESPLPQFRVNLHESHGCIHVRPTDIDVMIGTGYLKRGQSVVVHAYNDNRVYTTLKADRYTRPGFEVHFFPEICKLVVYKVV
jgi:hypothetical protein